ncbi:MAG: hypothetical protein U5N86_07940 [Planctomycetota bacterium]|nr:hypothetical protein [Planctomycetota bacterium]
MVHTRPETLFKGIPHAVPAEVRVFGVKRVYCAHQSALEKLGIFVAAGLAAQRASGKRQRLALTHEGEIS